MISYIVTIKEYNTIIHALVNYEEALLATNSSTVHSKTVRYALIARKEYLEKDAY